MGKVMSKCANCGGLLFGGTKEGELRFCSRQCRQYHSHPGFCEQCVHDTTEENVGGTFTVNLVAGTRLMAWGSDICPRCGARPMRKWFWFLLPLFPVSAQYRVLYQTPRRYLSRKMRIGAS